jgi:cobalt/nickel transport system permease protein
VPAWYVANQKAKAALSEPRAVPLLAAGAAFSFLVMLLNLPVLGGTTAHAVGAVLIAVIAGPWVAVLAVTAALAIQALLFADGGLLALGLNCLNLAVVMPLLGYLVYRLLAGSSPLLCARRFVAVAAAAYVGILASAFLVGLELGIQPLLHSEDGIAQYAPYGLSTALGAMLGSHLLIAGPVEAAFTVAVFVFLARTDPELFAAGDLRTLRARPLWAVALALVVAAPLGLIATGTAWGEWGADEIGRRIGYVPEGLQAASDWRGLMPDYALPGADAGWAAAAVYVAAALLGIAVLLLAAWALVRLARRRSGPSGR